MSDGTIVNTDKAIESWDESTHFNGSNHISDATGSQWEHQKLYKSRKGRYYLEHWSQWQGSEPHAEWLSNEAAARWLLLCGHPLPDDLEAVRSIIEE